MALKLVDQEEAARILGVTPDQVKEMRDRGEIHGYRDGGNWKFKAEDLAKIAASKSSDDQNESWSSDISSNELSLEEPDSILLGDDDGAGGGSTVVGKQQDPGVSDIHLSDNDNRNQGSSSDLALVDSIVVGGSDVQPAGSGPDEIELSDSDELSLDEDLKLAESSIAGKTAGSDLNLAGDDDGDDEGVLDSASDSDLTLGGGESGISLVNPADSGLSLEEAPIELGGGSGVELMDAGDEDVITLDADTDQDAATQIKADNDFRLTALEEGADESDSGSQVIALDTEDEGGGMFAPADSMGAMLEEDTGGGQLSAAGSPGLAGGAMLAPSQAALEAPFPVWVFLFLLVISLFLMMSGMFLYDMMRHMWSWGEPTTVSSTLMDGILKLFE